MKPQKNRYPVDGLTDAPFVPTEKPFERPTLHLPLPDSPYHEYENTAANIRIEKKEEQTERGVWTIDI
ncbi:MAG: hypothetical protein R3A45_10180 [Bdellovibrionota bacterium]